MKNIVICLLVVCPILAFGQKHKDKLDTIFATMNAFTIIEFNERDTINLVAPGSTAYAGSFKNQNTVLLTAVKPSKECSSIYIKYNRNKSYNGNICYKEFIRAADLVLQFPQADSIPTIINIKKDITFDKESIEKQLMERRIGIAEGREKDRFRGKDGTAYVDGKMSFKLQDIMQDNFYLYLKLVVVNTSKEDYKIENVDFLYRNVSNEKDYKQSFPDGDNGVKVVEGKTYKALVYALPKFTITSKWKLFVTIKESSGIRKLELRIPYDIIKEAENFN